MSRLEKFPIKTIGGWRWPDQYINHPSGIAIDISWEENARFINNKPVTGKFYDPDNCIYSMAENSSVVRVFRKYGWDWGGGWRSLKDYMHFSYLGG